MDLVEVRWGDVDWIGLAQDRDRWRALLNSGTLKKTLFLGSKDRPGRGADNLTAIYENIV
jgi:hypothetical protein